MPVQLGHPLFGAVQVESSLFVHACIQAYIQQVPSPPGSEKKSKEKEKCKRFSHHNGSSPWGNHVQVPSGSLYKLLMCP